MVEAAGRNAIVTPLCAGQRRTASSSPVQSSFPATVSLRNAPGSSGPGVSREDKVSRSDPSTGAHRRSCLCVRTVRPTPPRDECSALRSITDCTRSLSSGTTIEARSGADGSIHPWKVPRGVGEIGQQLDSRRLTAAAFALLSGFLSVRHPAARVSMSSMAGSCASPFK